MGDSQTSTSGTVTHKHSRTSSDGSALRTGISEVETAETGVYQFIEDIGNTKNHTHDNTTENGGSLRSNVSLIEIGSTGTYIKIEALI
jgi:hypothetical protein